MRIIIEIDEPGRVSTAVQGKVAEAMGAPQPVQAGATMQAAAANGAAINAGAAPASVAGLAPTPMHAGDDADTRADAATGNAQSAGAARYEGALQ